METIWNGVFAVCERIQLLVFFSFLRMETDPMLAAHPTLQLSVADQEGQPWDYRSDIEVW